MNIHSCVYAYAQAYIYAYICIHMHMYAYICIHMHMYACTQAHRHSYIYVIVLYKTDHNVTVTEIHFLPVDESCTHALSRDAKYFTIDLLL